MAAVTGADVAAFLGRADDTELVDLAGTHAAHVTLIVNAYTRGNGFSAGTPNDDLAAVIVSAAARLAVNPDQNAREQIGDYQVTPATFQGFTLPETMVLNRYRRRAT